MFDIEFNPKGNSLLDEHLAVSGLEMNWVFSAIGAGAAIVGGIMGMNQARSANSNSRKQYKKQKAFNKKVAKKTNEYNKKADANQKANYEAMREFNHEVAMENWERGKEIHDYEYDQAMKQYEKSQAIASAQLGLNSREAAAAIESEHQALNDAWLEKQFSLRDSKFALQDELQAQKLAKQGVEAERRNVKAEGRLERQSQKDRLTIASQTAALDIAQQKSNLMQTYDNQALDTRSELANLSGTLTQQAINKKEQYAQLSGIKSRKSTGVQTIENTIEQLTAQADFAKQTAIIDGLLAEGQAALGQAGKSTVKAKQSTRAAVQRSLMQLTSDMSGKRKQAGIQLAELNAELSLAETGVGLNLQRIDATVSGAQAATGLNIQKINTAVRGAERDARSNLQRIQTDFGATTRDVRNQLGRQLNAERFANEGLSLKTASINDAIYSANRDHISNKQIIDANYESAKGQAELNIKNIGIQKEFADLNTQANMMIKPEELPYAPKPKQPPEHIFLESMKAIPGFTPSPAMQNIYAPLVQGVGSAAGHLANIDFGGNS